MAYPFQIVNRRGTAKVTSASVAVNADNVVFTFPNHAFYNAWYQGGVYVELAQAIPTGTTGTLPIVFETNGTQQAITKQGGTAATVDDIEGVGVYHFFFDSRTQVLQLIN